MLKAVTLDLTTSYANVLDIIAAQSGKPASDITTLFNGEYTNTGTVNARVSINAPNISASDYTSFVLEPGESKPFDETNLNYVSCKSIGASSAGGLEITGSNENG